MNELNDSGQQKMPSLDELRNRINAIDGDLLLMISERARLAQCVAHVKLAEDSDTVFYRPEREAQILRRIMTLNQGPLANEEMARLFREIMSSCLALEQPISVAYLGPNGTYSQQAMMKHFGGAVTGVSVVSIPDVFRQVESEQVAYGVVPVENSTEGAINQTFDLFVNSNVRICGEIFLPIHNNLIGRKGALDEPIERIYSHPQPLAQCRSWLAAHYPQAELLAVSSNAEAVRLAEQDKGSVAIAGSHAIDYFDVDILVRNIEDLASNVTHFLVIGREHVKPSGNDRTMLLATMHNQPGTLERLIEPLSRHKVDITHIESRPSRVQPWHYVFFVEVKGHSKDGSLATALEEFENSMIDIRILGSWPSAVI